MTDPRHPIIQLPDSLINQIAAGEVVERPASVVKELVENALDAGATRIDIEVSGGGTEKIRVADDGQGLARDELLLAVQRHCTSKLRAIEDLLNIGTLGFRGEALPSIAAVSNFSISSRTAADEHGWQINSIGNGSENQAVPCARPAGTTVNADCLFERVPARRKFLRSQRTELHHIQQFVQRIALARTEVAISLKHNDRTVLRAVAADDEVTLARRLQRICGAEFVSQALPVAAHSDAMSVTGWVSPVEYARNQSDLQYVVLNGRVIRDPVIMRAVRRAYEDKLAAGRQPAYVLTLNLPGDAFDVNVHPAKTEVRFSQPRVVHDFVLQGVRRALADTHGGAEDSAKFAVETESGAVYGNAHPVARQFVGAHARGGAAADTRGSWSVYERSNCAAPGVGAEHKRCVQRIDDEFLILQEGEILWALDLPRFLDTVLIRCCADSNLARRPFLVPEPIGAPERTVDSWRELALELDQRGPEQWVLRSAPACLGEIHAARLAKALMQAGSSREDSLRALVSQVSDRAIEILLGSEKEADVLQSCLRPLDTRVLRRAWSDPGT